MIELNLYKNGELVKTCKVAFVSWKATRFCASLVKADGTFKDQKYIDDPMRLYEDLVLCVFANQVDEKLFEEYEVKGSEIINIGRMVLHSVKNPEEEKN